MWRDQAARLSEIRRHNWDDDGKQVDIAIVVARDLTTYSVQIVELSSH